MVDQRGTGRSHPLHCETEQQGPLDERIDLVGLSHGTVLARTDLRLFPQHV
jgi:hypothetical protein